MSVTQRSINVSSIPCLFSKEEKRKKKPLFSSFLPVEEQQAGDGSLSKEPEPGHMRQEDYFQGEGVVRAKALWHH